MEACKEFIQNEESKINIDEVLGNINYGEWLDKLACPKCVTGYADHVNFSDRLYPSD